MAEQVTGSEAARGKAPSAAAARPRIVVGVDGSDQSAAALRWAVGQAGATGSEVEVVVAYEMPVTILLEPVYSEDDYRRDAQEVADRAVARMGPDPSVPVRSRLVEGRAAHALTDAAEGADLLVLGSHGRGQLPGMHLGSVASYCVHHAPCPVVVVRGEVPRRR